MTSQNSQATKSGQNDASSIKTKQFSLVMATYGRARELEPAINSLIAQTDHGFELIVVDQNKDDRVVPLLEPARAAGLMVRHVRQDVPNLSLARNTGLACATGEIVAFPDDDCWYEPEVIAQVRSAFETDGQLDGVVARWVEIEPQGTRPREALTAEAWRQFRGGDATSFTLFLRKSQLAALGGFDTRLGTGQWYGAGEETDVILSLLDRGNRIDHVPSARIHHFLQAEIKASRALCRRERLYGRGTGALWVKHKLPVWVRLRGLTAPLMRAPLERNPFSNFAVGACKVWGRLEGMIGWQIEHGSRVRPPGQATTNTDNKRTGS